MPGVCEGGGPQVRGAGKGLGFQGPGGGLSLLLQVFKVALCFEFSVAFWSVALPRNLSC